MNDNTLKKCTSCDQFKTLNDYHKMKNGKYGRHNHCKQCRSNKTKSLKYKRLSNDVLVLCPKCQQKLPSSNFYSDKTSSNGLQTYCKTCSKKNRDNWTCNFEGFISLTYGTLIQNAKKRKLVVDLTKQDIIDLYHKQNGKCALSGRDMIIYHIENMSTDLSNHAMSIDRIDSSRGYTLNNVQLVCNMVNKMKWDLKQEDFLYFCGKFVEYYKIKNDKLNKLKN